ncbi:immunoglobulin-like domain-containing protein [Bacillus seohaeanensis]|jgi:hypothetical protein|uniref:Immunoglobulin-like domain-containing protein n=1 Tax=Bacillus seohaeanensis TaxID=284580 RepID=A0ABW5RYU4_9BACI
MMKKYPLAVFCFALLLIFFSGCRAPLTEEAPVQKRADSKNGITIKTEKVEYPTSVKKIIVKIQNDSPKEFSTGIHVFLEKKVKDTWYKVPMKDESFTELGFMHPPNKSSTLVLNVNDLKYKLTPGEYRATIGELAAPFEVVE